MVRSSFSATSGWIDGNASRLATVKAPINRAAAISANRNGVLRSRPERFAPFGLARRMQAIAGVADRMQELNGERPVDLRAQAADVRLDDAGLGIEVEVPYPFEQHGARHHPALVAHQDFEQRELAGLQFDAHPAARYRPLYDVEFEI